MYWDGEHASGEPNPSVGYEGGISGRVSINIV